MFWISTHTMSAAALAAVLGCAQGLGDQDAQVSYAYYYKGELMTLTPSQRLVAVRAGDATIGDRLDSRGFRRDPLSDHSPLKQHDLALYSLPVADSSAVDIQDLARQTADVVQPVFEQGGMLLIPGDEINLKFRSATSLEEARAFVERLQESQGIIDVREGRRGSFVLTIDRPSNGRVYAVCRYLTEREEVDYAEPNHIIVRPDDPTTH